MEERDANRAERLPGEVVETYRRPDPREVVEVYTRPLPGTRRPEQPKAKPKKHKGVWIFAGCLCVAVVLATAAFALRWAWHDDGGYRHDRF